MIKEPEVTLTLSGDTALVLNAVLSNSANLGIGQLSAPEQIAVWELEAELERHLVATFAPDYDVVLEAARQSLVARGGEPAAGPSARRDGWMCCFCGQSEGQSIVAFVELQFAVGDCGTQGLRCHSKCLRRYVHPSVPLP